MQSFRDLQRFLMIILKKPNNSFMESTNRGFFRNQKNFFWEGGAIREGAQKDRIR